MPLAQVNIARFMLPAEHPNNLDFTNNIDRVNALAEAAPGFIWRFEEYPEDGQALYPEDPLMIVNISVWRDIESLMAFVYRNSEHKAIMRRRKEWFEHIKFHLALWHVPVGHKPSVAEAKQKLAHIAEHGASPEAFNFARCFDSDGQPLSINLDRPSAVNLK